MMSIDKTKTAPGTLLRYQEPYCVIPGREEEVFLVVDKAKIDGRDYLVVLSDGELRHFGYDSLFLYEVFV
jgi:hypothetical protein